MKNVPKLCLQGQSAGTCDTEENLTPEQADRIYV